MEKGSELNIDDYWRLSTQDQLVLLERLRDFVFEDIFAVILQRQKANQLFREMLEKFIESLLEKGTFSLGSRFSLRKHNENTQLLVGFSGKTIIVSESAPKVLSNGLMNYLLGEKDGCLIDHVFKDYDEHLQEMHKTIPKFQEYKQLIQTQIERSFPHEICEDDFPPERYAKQIDKPDIMAQICQELIENYEVPQETITTINSFPTFNIMQEDSIYLGDWKNGERGDLGLAVFGKNEWWYFGHWKSNLPFGDGCLVFADGSHYEGGFNLGLLEGQGTFTDTEGNVYEGSWEKGRFHGKGKLTLANGASYQGEFSEGQFHGHGVYTWPNGDRYEGFFKEGQFGGTGTYHWKNGKKYSGEWALGLIEGFGELVLNDGISYSGEYEHSRKNGKGLLKFPNGTCLEGMWKNGLQDGKFWITNPNGVKRRGFWEKGVFQDWIPENQPDTAK